MKKYEKTQMRVTCLMQAIGLKQNTLTSEEYSQKKVIEIAKELEDYILNDTKEKK